MPDDSKDKKPEVFVFAEPNGSGKSTITQLAKIAGIYINADDIKKTNHCTDLEATIHNLSTPPVSYADSPLKEGAIFRLPL